MKKELEFAKTLEKIKILAKEQQNVVSRKQVGEAFEAIGIKGGQLEPIFQYLNAKNIGIEEPVNSEERLSGEEKKYLREYQEMMKSFLPLTEGEKRTYTMAAMIGDGSGKEKLYHHYLPQVVDLAKLYVGQGVFLEDLIGEGNLALATGMEMLGCLEEPEEAEGMLGKMMMDAMEDHIRKNAEAKKRDMALVERADHLQEMAKELAESLHRKITVKELAEETKIEEEEIKEVLRLSANGIEYFEE